MRHNHVNIHLCWKLTSTRSQFIRQAYKHFGYTGIGASVSQHILADGMNINEHRTDLFIVRYNFIEWNWTFMRWFQSIESTLTIQNIDSITFYVLCNYNAVATWNSINNMVFDFVSKWNTHFVTDSKYRYDFNPMAQSDLQIIIWTGFIFSPQEHVKHNNFHTFKSLTSFVKKLVLVNCLQWITIVRSDSKAWTIVERLLIITIIRISTALMRFVGVRVYVHVCVCVRFFSAHGFVHSVKHK